MAEGSMDVNHSGLRQTQAAPGGAQNSASKCEWSTWDRNRLAVDGAVATSTSDQLGTEMVIGEMHTATCLMPMPTHRRLSYMEFIITEGGQVLRPVADLWFCNHVASASVVACVHSEGGHLVRQC